MKFKAQAHDLSAALDLVSSVTPEKNDSTGGMGGFLFSVRDGRCYVYSRDNVHVARADFEVEADEEGQFIYPTD